MQSIREVYKIGAGPSSSHTMGPQQAIIQYLNKFPKTEKLEVTLYGSLALTGKGHLTDYIIEKTAGDIPVTIIMDFKKSNLKHPNYMKIKGDDDDDKVWDVYSIGGGDIIIEQEIEQKFQHNIYHESNFNEIKAYCQVNNLSLLEYIYQNEPELPEYLKEVWQVMQEAIARGIKANGRLPGRLQVKKKASLLNKSQTEDEKLMAYAYAVNEENASGGVIVTAPTCGASGLLPATLKYLQEKNSLTEEKMINALAIAGIFGVIVKNNATISGAEGGCQAEVGVATAMAAAAISYLEDGSLDEIETAAEIGLEHQLGLTCDPVFGLVQIPCIQRNAMGAIKAKSAAIMAKSLAGTEKVDFDTIVQVMYETGKDLAHEYRETSLGGLAKFYLEKE